MKTIELNKKNIPVPSNWDELKQSQILKISIARMQVASPKNQADLSTLKMLYFSVITDIPQWKQKNFTSEQWVDLLKLTEFLFDTPKFTANPFMRVRISMTMVLHGPIGYLETSCFAEFMTADNAFIDFHNNRNPDAAYLLFATLWRKQRSDLKQFKQDPDQWNEDVRVPFNQSQCEAIAAKLKTKKRVAPYAMMAVIYYESFRSQAVTGNPLLKPLFNKAAGFGKKSSGLGWMETLIAQSGTKFGDFNSTSRTNWLLVLIDVAIKLNQKQELEKQNS